MTKSEVNMNSMGSGLNKLNNRNMFINPAPASVGTSFTGIQQLDSPGFPFTRE